MIKLTQEWEIAPYVWVHPTMMIGDVRATLKAMTLPSTVLFYCTRAAAAGVSDDLDWSDNENRVHGKRYGRINERH
jgi:hypothetical protein